MTKIVKNILLYGGALALSATFAMATCGTGKCDSAKKPAQMTKCESGKSTGSKCNGDMNKSKTKCGGDMKKEMPPKPAPAKGKCGQGKCG